MKRKENKDLLNSPVIGSKRRRCVQRYCEEESVAGFTCSLSSCGLSFKDPGSLESHLNEHLAKEIRNMEKTSAKQKSKRAQPEKSTNSLSELRNETYQRLCERRERRRLLSSRDTDNISGSGEGVVTVCQVCLQDVDGSLQDHKQHLKSCIKIQKEPDPTLDAYQEFQDDDEEFEEYEWSGQTRIRATSLVNLESGGDFTRIQKTDETEDCDVTGEMDNFGPQQYSHDDIVRLASASASSTSSLANDYDMVLKCSGNVITENLQNSSANAGNLKSSVFNSLEDAGTSSVEYEMSSGSPVNSSSVPGTSSEKPDKSPLSPGTSSEKPGTSSEIPGTPSEKARKSPLSPGTSLVSLGTSSVSPGTSSEKPRTSSENPRTSLVSPGTSSEKPGTPTVNPGTSSEKPGISSVSPGTSSKKPGTSSVSPGTSSVSLGISSVNPETSSEKPEAFSEHPETPCKSSSIQSKEHKEAVALEAKYKSLQAAYESLQAEHESMRMSSVCRVCLDVLSRHVVSTVCWHVLCEICWSKVLVTKKMCPQCKAIVTASDLRRIYL